MTRYPDVHLHLLGAAEQRFVLAGSYNSLFSTSPEHETHHFAREVE